MYRFDRRISAQRAAARRNAAYTVEGDRILPTDDARQTYLDCTYIDGDELPSHFNVTMKWEVCGTCEGHGRHVDPSIDACGISREDFDNDPDFEEDYFGGRYDVSCYECDGRRVMPAFELRLDIRNSLALKPQFDWLMEYASDSGDDWSEY